MRLFGFVIYRPAKQGEDVGKIKAERDYYKERYEAIVRIVKASEGSMIGPYFERGIKI